MGWLATGCALNYGSSSGVGGTTIAALKEISLDGVSRDAVESTAHDLTSNWRTFEKGLKDAGGFSFSGNYLPENASHNLAAGFNKEWSDDSTTLIEWTIVLANTAGDIIYGNGMLTDFACTNPVDGLIECSGTIKINGVITLP